jgi:hypothetical protein
VSATGDALWWNEGAFLYFGRMGANKGVPQVVQAWLRLRERLGEACPDLWLVGGSPGEIEMMRSEVGDPEMLSPLEQRGRLRWWGYLDEAGVSALLLKTRALVVHSAYEPGGRVILEALTQGVPVIATPHGFACDLVRDWVTGFIVGHGDIDLLCHRMEHFARQPLLSASMGLAARATALGALESWDFYRAHGRIYREVATAAEPGPLGGGTPPRVVADPCPAGLVGRYPFAAAAPDGDAALGVAVRQLDLSRNDCSLAPLASRDGVLRWRIEAGRQRWVVFHNYTVYVRRSLWDRDYVGPLFRAGAERRRAEAAAAALPGFAPIVEDELGVLQLREDLPPALTAGSPAERFKTALGPLRSLWNHRPSVEEEARLRGRAAQWWDERNAMPWRTDPAAAAVLRTASLRVAWAETAAKLGRGDIMVGDGLAELIADADAVCAAVAVSEDELAPIGTQHGDPFPLAVRSGPAGPCLIRGEFAAPGWWGRDAALMLMRVADPSDSRSSDWWVEGLNALGATEDNRAIVFLWVVIETIFEIADALASAPQKPPRDAEAKLEAAIQMLRLASR